MSAGNRALIDPSKRLPDSALPSTSDGRLIRIRPPGRRSPLLVFVHGSDCVFCHAFLDLLASGIEALRDWDAIPLAVLREETPGGSAAESFVAITAIIDSGQCLSSMLSIDPPAVIVADQWGEIHLRHAAGDNHNFPSLEELVEWFRFLSIQCPECQGEAW